MQISARVQNSEGQHAVTLRTGDRVHSLNIAPAPAGSGSATNGGELLFLALATCFCNDLYREAARRGLNIRQVEVEVTGEFGAEGEAASNVTYHVRVAAQENGHALRDLLRHVDRVAEIHNTLRVGTSVVLDRLEIVDS